MSEAFLRSAISTHPVRRGKVRDIYDFGDRLLFIATDRISAFDRVLPNGIPDKGRVLTQTSQFWFEHLDVPHEVLTSDSSRFWPADDYEAGRGQKSFDKQFVRDWLETTDWDKESDPPRLPDDIVANTRTQYIEAFTRLAERPFDWD